MKQRGKRSTSSRARGFPHESQRTITTLLVQVTRGRRFRRLRVPVRLRAFVVIFHRGAVFVLRRRRRLAAAAAGHTFDEAEHTRGPVLAVVAIVVGDEGPVELDE